LPPSPPIFSNCKDKKNPQNLVFQIVLVVFLQLTIFILNDMENTDPIIEDKRYVANDIINRCAMMCPESACA